MNFALRYKGQHGACASCCHVRSYIDGDIHDGRTLLPYDGSKYAACVKKPSVGIAMIETPRNDLPGNDCWQPCSSSNNNNDVCGSKTTNGEPQ